MKNIILFLSLFCLIIWISVFTINSDLKIIACDVGQGDSILLQHKSFQILIDGGPNNKVLDCLGKYMPFWDREIEVVFLTHPDIDHYGGLVDVFKNYKVKNYFTNGDKSSSESYKVLESLVVGQGSNVVVAKEGMGVRYDLIHLDILWPLEQNKSLESEVRIDGDNNNSVVILLDYGQFEALFTGDVEQEISDILSENNKIKDIEYIKVNHHGSRNGMTENLLKQVTPEIAVISAGIKNRYGHPHAEILEMLQRYKVQVLRTDEMGDVVITK